MSTTSGLGKENVASKTSSVGGHGEAVTSFKPSGVGPRSGSKSSSVRAAGPKNISHRRGKPAGVHPSSTVSTVDHAVAGGCCLPSVSPQPCERSPLAPVGDKTKRQQLTPRQSAHRKALQDANASSAVPLSTVVGQAPVAASRKEERRADAVGSADRHHVSPAASMTKAVKQQQQQQKRHQVRRMVLSDPVPLFCVKKGVGNSITATRRRTVSNGLAKVDKTRYPSVGKRPKERNTSGKAKRNVKENAVRPAMPVSKASREMSHCGGDNSLSPSSSFTFDLEKFGHDGSEANSYPAGYGPEASAGIHRREKRTTSKGTVASRGRNISSGDEVSGSKSAHAKRRRPSKDGDHIGGNTRAERNRHGPSKAATQVAVDVAYPSDGGPREVPSSSREVVSTSRKSRSPSMAGAYSPKGGGWHLGMLFGESEDEEETNRETGLWRLSDDDDAHDEGDNRAKSTAPETPARRVISSGPKKRKSSGAGTGTDFVDGSSQERQGRGSRGGRRQSFGSRSRDKVAKRSSHGRGACDNDGGCGNESELGATDMGSGAGDECVPSAVCTTVTASERGAGMSPAAVRKQQEQGELEALRARFKKVDSHRLCFTR